MNFGLHNDCMFNGVLFGGLHPQRFRAWARVRLRVRARVLARLLRRRRAEAKGGG